jgi:hypothetical protein
MRFAALLLLAAVLWAYWPVGGHEFLNYDDPIRVTENAWVRQGLSARGVAWASTTLLDGNWHPLTWLSHMLDCTLAGLDPGWHHRANLALHAASSLILLAALDRMTGAPWRSAMVALLFALHPLHVESVAWVSERKDTLSGLFFMLAIYAYAHYTERPSWQRYAPLVLAFACGLASKAMVVTLPIVLLLLDVWPLARHRQSSIARLLVEKLPLLALAGLVAALTVFAQHQAGAMSSAVALPLGVRVAQAILASVAYIGKTLWPQGLTVFYPYPSQILLWNVALAALLLLVLSAGAVRAAARYPYLLVGWCWYLVTLLPVIGLVQVGLQAMADRYTYLPLVGLFIAAVWGVSDLLAQRAFGRRALVPLALATSAACLVLTRIQVGYWRDDVPLYEHALAVTSDNYLAHNNLALELVNENRLVEAREHFVEALRIQPGYPDARNNLAGVLIRQGRIEEAIAQLRTAVENSPGYAPGHRNLAALLQQAGRKEEAATHYREALRLEAGGGAH